MGYFMIDPSFLVKEYSDLAYNLAYRMIGDRDDAYDIVQDAFVAVIDKLDKIENQKAYLLKTVYNQALNHIKRKQKLVYQTEPVSGAFETQPDTELENKNRNRAAAEQLKNLSDKQREIITYRFWGEMKLVEIARLMKINEATVRVHLARGLNKLREFFDKGENNEM